MTYITERITARTVHDLATRHGEAILAACGVPDAAALALLRLTGVPLRERFLDRWSDHFRVVVDDWELPGDQGLRDIAVGLAGQLPQTWGEAAVRDTPLATIRLAGIDEPWGLHRPTGEIVVTSADITGSIAAGLGWRVVAGDGTMAAVVEDQRRREERGSQRYGPAGRAGLAIGWLISDDLDLLDLIPTRLARWRSLAMVMGLWVDACAVSVSGSDSTRLDGSDPQTPQAGTPAWISELADAVGRVRSAPGDPYALADVDRLITQLVPGWTGDTPLMILRYTADALGIPRSWMDGLADIITVARSIQAGGPPPRPTPTPAQVRSAVASLRLAVAAPRDEEWEMRVRRAIWAVQASLGGTSFVGDHDIVDVAYAAMADAEQAILTAHWTRDDDAGA